ncbi:hypothetical protein HMPREF1074_03879 [Bacteroides xylanisolvens CL03T12C04]|jgi:glycosyltransferase involved in cell wall biosynthesis|uniref:Glycosyl transferase family 1 domain-containing protein n=2 Tax=Bacteroides xylanisolvens TaxID=371601 RepID=I9JDF7_9BACE|nr:hypothetical protein HMPREF1074_03879 [Bacteroides xylanisolvens CL03T12C04]MBT0703329.1 Glycosyl transferases group 1 [Bacteroides xylanisolvens CL03T12C04]RGI95811.1 glycosyltransferase [Bacteroides xylanisolvens]
MHIGQLVGGLDIYIRNSLTYMPQGSLKFIIVHGKCDNNEPIRRGDELLKEYSVNLYRPLSLWNDLICLIKIIKIIRNDKPDVIHCHSAKGGFIGRLAGFVTRTKTVYTPHAFSFLCSPSPLKKQFYLILERLSRFNSYLLACSESERKMGIEIVHYKESKALVWRNAVPDASNWHSDVKIKDERFICYIGRPCYQKNPFFLLDVIREVIMSDADLKFYWLGVGYHSPDLAELKRKIEEWNLDKNIVLLPWLSHKMCLEYVRKSLFYLSVSLYEGLPLSIIEAMSLGKAVIASDVVGNRDCVCHNVNGFLLPFDKKIFAEKIEELIVNEERRSLFEKKSRDLYLSKFQIKNQVLELQKIYESE